MQPPTRRLQTISTSAICTFGLPLDGDLAFWRRHAIEVVGVSVAKLDAFGWDAGSDLLVEAIRTDGLRVDNLIGVGPFRLDDPTQWDDQRRRLVRSLETAARLDCSTIVFTTGPAGSLTWEQAADALEAALEPVLSAARDLGVTVAIEHTNSLRVDVGFVHTLRDVIDLARRLDSGVCMELNACWAERDLARTIRDGIDVISLVQVSDFAVGTLSTPNRLVPGDGDIPIATILATLLHAGYAGSFDLELIGPRIEAEGYDTAIPRARVALGEMLATIAIT